ncbi:MAG: D-glycero-alpha-D-manno-heptose-1,7-bisphosphate 7-phosphatase [Acidobacteriota bacterium]
MALSLRERPRMTEVPKKASPPYQRTVFLDKDGTLIEDVPFNVDPSRLRLTPYAIEGLRALQDAGYRLIVVTNQPGLARRLFDRAALNQAHAALSRMLLEGGVRIDDYFVCPHAAVASRLEPGCLCRKPAPGLLRQAAVVHRIDLANSWMVGDILNDVEAGHRAGCRSVLLDVGNETEWRLTPIRTPEVRAANLMEAAQAILQCEARPARSSLAPDWSMGNLVFATPKTES